MKVNDMFPSRFLTGEDLAGKTCQVTIAQVKAEQMRDPQSRETVTKWVLYFSESKSGRGLVLNKTLAGQIAKALTADDTEAWTGKKIAIYPEAVNVGGVARVAIRAKAANGGQA